MHRSRASATRQRRAQAPAPGQWRWYRGAIVTGRPRVLCVVGRRARGVLRRAPAALAVAVTGTSAPLLAGCGGGSLQDTREPSGTFTMKVLHASFPDDQAIARQTRLELEVRNTGRRTVPNVAVTIDSFSYTSDYPELAADKRPVWVIERGPGAIAEPPVESQEVSLPGGGQTAYVNTWALGALGPGQTRTFTWRVVPVKAGAHTVHYAVAADLAGNKARAVLASGARVQGQFSVDVAPAPPSTHVNPSTGKVEGGLYPKTP